MVKERKLRKQTTGSTLDTDNRTTEPRGKAQTDVEKLRTDETKVTEATIW